MLRTTRTLSSVCVDANMVFIVKVIILGVKWDLRATIVVPISHDHRSCVRQSFPIRL